MMNKGRTKAIKTSDYPTTSLIVKLFSLIKSCLLPIRLKPFKITLDKADWLEYQKCLKRSKKESQGGKILISEGDFVEYTYWNGDTHMLGYLNDYPNSWMQGKTKKELEYSLKRLYEDIDSRLSASNHV